MNKFIASFISAFVATIILSIMMVIKFQSESLPGLDAIHDYSHFFGVESRSFGWFIQYLVGTFWWGWIFAFIAEGLPGYYWWRGIVFGFIAWLIIMIIYMPIMQHGFFASDIGFGAVVLYFIYYIIYGFVLGLIYGWFPKTGIAAPKK